MEISSGCFTCNMLCRLPNLWLYKIRCRILDSDPAPTAQEVTFPCGVLVYRGWGSTGVEGGDLGVRAGDVGDTDVREPRVQPIVTVGATDVESTAKRGG